MSNYSCPYVRGLGVLVCRALRRMGLGVMVGIGDPKVL